MMMMTDLHHRPASCFASSCCSLIGCRSARGGVWTQLQDVHEALGLRYQWGGSHGNKVLLCCLGIDTRNIVSLMKVLMVLKVLLVPS